MHPYDTLHSLFVRETCKLSQITTLEIPRLSIPVMSQES
jgi:hypothetical protein